LEPLAGEVRWSMGPFWVGASWNKLPAANVRP
jgi:hypothetical protein